MTESSVFNSSVGGFVINMMKLEAIQLLHICTRFCGSGRSDVCTGKWLSIPKQLDGAEYSFNVKYLNSFRGTLFNVVADDVGYDMLN